MRIFRKSWELSEVNKKLVREVILNLDERGKKRSMIGQIGYLTKVGSALH